MPFIREVVKTLPFPKKENLRTVLFTCLDPRLNDAHKDLMEGVLKLSPGEYFCHRTKGAVSGISHHDSVTRVDWYETLKLLVDKDVGTIVLAPHTNCAGDAMVRQFTSKEADFQYQEEKLVRCTQKISEFANRLHVHLKVMPYVFDFSHEIEIVRLNDVNAVAQSVSH